MHICYAIFAGISLRLCSISLRSFRITFAAYLPTHIKSLRDFFQSLLNNHRDNLYIISKLKEAAQKNAFGYFDTASLYHMRQSLVLFQKFHANTWTVGRHGHLTVHNLDAVESVVGDEPVAIEVSPVAEWRKLSRSGHSA